jgi:pantetheine-phosphate adenylyltransferase
MTGESRKALFPGTFDPVTLGHLDLVERALEVFGEVIVAVAEGHHKSTLFSLEERVSMFREAARALPGVTVTSFRGLLVDLAKEQGTHVVVRGLRMVSDFEYEYQMALMNRKLDAKIETVFLMPSAKYTFVNSTVIKEIGRFGGRLDGLVPDIVRDRFEAMRKDTRVR